MSRIFLSTMLASILLPLMLACHSSGDPAPTVPDPNGNSLTFQFNGQTTAVAGSWGTSWAILASPQVIGGNRLHLNGPGTLVDVGRNVLDLNSSGLPNAGYYIPPATVPAGGTTVTMSMEAYWTPTQQWIRSPDYSIQVVQQTMPMSYAIYPGPPTSVTLHSGQTAFFAGTVIPRPLDFQQNFVIIPDQPTTADLGTAKLTTAPLPPIEWGVDYVAPSVITTPMNLTVRAVAHDPWFNLDPHVDFTVHLIPN